MIGPKCARCAWASVVEGRPDSDLDAGQASHRLDATIELRRIEHALETFEPRREIGDAESVAVCVSNRRLHDRGVSQIAALGSDPIVQDHVTEARLLFAPQQAREDT